MEHGKYYEKFKRWFNMEDQNKNVPLYSSAEMTHEPTNYVLFELNAELLRLRIENHKLKERLSTSQHWMDQAKEQAGYDRTVPFDIVWGETLELANLWKEQHRGKDLK